MSVATDRTYLFIGLFRAEVKGRENNNPKPLSETTKKPLIDFPWRSHGTEDDDLGAALCFVEKGFDLLSDSCFGQRLNDFGTLAVERGNDDSGIPLTKFRYVNVLVILRLVGGGYHDK